MGFNFYCLVEEEEDETTWKACIPRKLRLASLRNRRRVLEGERRQVLSKTESSTVIKVFSATRYLAIWDVIGDARYLLKAYWFSQAVLFQFNTDYKWAVLIAFFAVFSPYWITFSGLLNIQSIDESF